MKKFRDEPSTSRTPDMSYSSTSTTSSTLSGGPKFGFEPQQSSQQSAGLVINTNAIHHSLKVESPPSSPGSEASARKRRKGTNSSATPQQSPHAFVDAKKERDEKDPKSTPVLQNGTLSGPVTHHHMLGNTLNPASSAAKSMSETLSMEIEAHSIYTSDPQPNFTGPQYPGRKDSSKNSSASSSTTSSGPASITSMLSGSSSNGAPQSLEQLLERQWEQGSQFLMEQAQHFDIASLLSCLHQLKIENSRLEEHINSLISRRDHLLAVNARLAIPLSQPTNQVTHNGPSEVPPSQNQQQPPPQQQTQQPPPQITAPNKRSTSSSNTINQVQPVENGLDYRGHHPISSSNQIPSSSSSQQQSSGNTSNNIRHSPAMSSAKNPIVVPPSQLSQLVTIDTNPHQPPPPQQQSQQQLPNPHQFPQHPQNAVQFQQSMYQQQQSQHQTSNLNSMRSRQNSSYQTQQQHAQHPTGQMYSTAAVHKTKN